jgi:hypothetical protein
VNERDGALRRLVAAEHGLDPTAAKFLIGTTIEELEVSADALACLFAARGRPEQEDVAVPNGFAGAAQNKEDRKRALIGVLTGRARTMTETDATRPTGGFDGGARPMELRHPESHDELVARLLLEQRAAHHQPEARRA